MDNEMKMVEINFAKVKLVIWDLDDTFWHGTLSEGEIKPICTNIELVRSLTLRGIVNSICSKNDEESVTAQLKKLKIDNYFVFNSINWLPKGERIRQIIEDMQLRDENVLFIDDNVSNLQEAKFYNPNLMIATPSILDDLTKQLNHIGKDDSSLSRLDQYKILEKKKEAKKSVFSNEEFLHDCQIVVDIDHDCLTHIKRIHELLLRSNQLNFTKKRSTLEELNDDIKYCDDCGVVTVKDKYGDYGICGFYLLKNDELKHFLFSCRSMGMGIEQYIYLLLNKPKIEICGEVSSDLNQYKKIDWINASKESNNDQRFVSSTKCLFKGPCDLQQLFSFIKDNQQIDVEFTFINEIGVSNESWNHTSQICEAFELSESQKNSLISDLPFADSSFFKTTMFTNKYQYVFLSMLTDPNLGLYRRKKDGIIFAFGEWCHDLTNHDEWNDYISGKNFNANFKFKKEILEHISENYECLGRISEEELVENLKKIRGYLPKESTLVLLLGSEIPYTKNKSEAYIKREDYHRNCNQLIREAFSNSDNVKLINFTDYVDNEDDYINNINHFKKKVYYHVAQKAIDIINSSNLSNEIKLKSREYLYFSSFLQKIEMSPIIVNGRKKASSIKREILRKTKKSA